MGLEEDIIGSKKISQNLAMKQIRDDSIQF